MTYLCRACGTERDFEELIGVAGPGGGGWYCRDSEACRGGEGTVSDAARIDHLTEQRDILLRDCASLRARLAAIEAERDGWETAGRSVKAMLDKAEVARDVAVAKLEMPCGSCHPCVNWVDERWRREGRKPPDPLDYADLKARLAAVEALCDGLMGLCDWSDGLIPGRNPRQESVRAFACKIRAAARGEGDRPALIRSRPDVSRLAATVPMDGEGDRPATHEFKAPSPHWSGLPARHPDLCRRCYFPIDDPIHHSGEGDRPTDTPSAALVQTVREMYTDTAESHMPGWKSGEGDRG